MTEPSAGGRFGEYGGLFVPESLVPACQELERAFRSAWGAQDFRDDYVRILEEHAGRPTPVTDATRLSERLGVRVLL